MKRYLTILLVCLAMGMPLIAGAATYQLDTDHSSIQFKIRHLTVSNVTGAFNKMKGSASVEGEDLATLKVEVTIDAASVDTGHPKRDEHIRTADFLDVAKYPTITFVSKKVVKADPGKLRITGDLTLHGVTREITVELEGPTPEIKDPWGNFRRGATGTAKIDRRDFGITWNKALDTGGLVVGNEVGIQVDIEWVRK
ncbi:MAG TPA: YceI family protein [Syntrophales bacterium]